MRTDINLIIDNGRTETEIRNDMQVKNLENVNNPLIEKRTKN